MLYQIPSLIQLFHPLKFLSIQGIGPINTEPLQEKIPRLQTSTITMKVSWQDSNQYFHATLNPIGLTAYRMESGLVEPTSACTAVERK